MKVVLKGCGVFLICLVTGIIVLTIGINYPGPGKNGLHVNHGEFLINTTNFSKFIEIPAMPHLIRFSLTFRGCHDISEFNNLVIQVTGYNDKMFLVVSNEMAVPDFNSHVFNSTPTETWWTFYRINVSDGKFEKKKKYYFKVDVKRPLEATNMIEAELSTVHY